MKSFKEALEKELTKSMYNNFGIENYDQYRFGETLIPSPSLFNATKAAIKKFIRYKNKSAHKFAKNAIRKVEEYMDGLDYVYKNVSQEDKYLIVKLIAYRILGYKKVKLPTNSKKYWNALKDVKKMKNPMDTYEPNFMDFILEKFDLNAIGYNVNLYFRDPGIVHDFILEQYAYKINGNGVVQAENGDVVLDIGACWGDTALYFSSKVGENGTVYSFEFVPDNVKVFDLNTSLNPDLKQRIKLISNPVSNITGDTIYFKDNGPGSRIEHKPFEGQTGSTTTIAIDDFVIKQNLNRVDFIKMDIEGAEPMALLGAIETIKIYKPKLAIAIYHSLEDFVNIPKWILELKLGYAVYINHYTIHSEETILFAIAI